MNSGGTILRRSRRIQNRECNAKGENDENSFALKTDCKKPGSSAPTASGNSRGNEISSALRSPLKTLCVNQSTTPFKHLAQVFNKIMDTGERPRLAMNMPILRLEDCCTVFTEESIDPKKFFSDNMTLKRYTKEAMSKLILSEYLLRKRITGLDHELKLYCLYLMCASPNYYLSDSCMDALLRWKNNIDLTYAELICVLANWGLVEVPLTELPPQLARCLPHPESEKSFPTPQNIKGYFNVLNHCVRNFSQPELLSLLPILVQIAMDPHVKEDLDLVTDVIDASLQLLFHHDREFNMYELVMRLDLSRFPPDNFAFICFLVLPKSDIGIKVKINASYWYIRINILKLGQLPSPNVVQIHSFATLLLNGEAQLLSLDEYTLYQFLFLLHTILPRFPLKSDDQKNLEDIASVLTQVKSMLDASCSRKQTKFYCLFMVQRCIQECNDHKSKIAARLERRQNR